MDIPPKNSNLSRADPTPLLRRLDQVTIALLLVVSLLMMGIAAGTRYWQGQGVIEIGRAPPLPLTFRVDVNQADWPELALLPEVGETLARRIVDFRQREGFFLEQEDLLRVPGIGPQTLQSMRPYLQPLPGAAATQ